jgi:phage replication-related protein YjqB (UPF0714/DUF867 family)
MPWSYQEIIGAGYESGRDFAVGTGNIDNIERCLLVSPHGGSIEPGTTDVMLAVANLGQWAHYNFQGQLPRRNWRELHIPSTHFDEPRLLGLLPQARFVLSFHGESDDERRTICVGGLYHHGRETFIACLAEDLAHLRVTVSDALQMQNEGIAGRSRQNITNRGTLEAGVQLEFSQGVRTLLFRNLNQSRRRQPTEHLGVLARSIDRALARLTGGR